MSFLNLHKCERLPYKNILASSINGILVRNSVTYLGILINKNEQSRCFLNFTPIIDKNPKILHHWLQRDICLKGRGLLSKAEGILRLTYAVQSPYVDNILCKSMNKLLYNFQWQNKTRYLWKSVALSSYDKRRLNLIDFAALNILLR